MDRLPIAQQDASTRDCAQDCNLVLYTGAGNGATNAIFSSGTYGKGNPPPCRMLVSSAGKGSFMVLDSANNVLFIRPTPPQGTLIAGQTLSQVRAPSAHYLAGPQGVVWLCVWEHCSETPRCVSVCARARTRQCLLAQLDPPCPALDSWAL